MAIAECKCPAAVNFMQELLPGARQKKICSYFQGKETEIPAMVFQPSTFIPASA